jgi:hypothetical protein
VTVVELPQPPRSLSPGQAAMVEANLDLIARVVRKYFPRTHRDEFDDRVSDGFFGLVRAAETFDPDHGTPFRGYASQCIRSAVRAGLERFSGISYRQDRTGFRRPLSLDEPISEDGRTRGDGLADGPLFSTEVPYTVDSEAQYFAYAACRTAADVALVSAIEDGLSLSQAAEHLGVAYAAIRQQKKRLTDRAREIKGVHAMPTSVLEFTCPECGDKFDRAASLGVHRRYKHDVHATNGSTPRAGATTKGPVLVELVDEEPPPPPAPKMKPVDQIIATVTAADMKPGRWQRIAVFPSPRAARSMATRLRGDAAAFEWLAADDGRLFVRLPETAAS